MDRHFKAFSFVDRISHLEPGAGIRGQFTIPATLDGFSVSLVSEAVGQLAAWAAMAAVGFTHRPVAGIAGQIELLNTVQPGQVLELAATLEAVDTESAGYGGSASVNGQPIVRLHNCVGPMLAVDEFDTPEALRERFNLLTTTGAAPGAFGGVPSLQVEPGPLEPGQSAEATLHVPGDAPFFADHFPRRPVFPGTLLTQCSMQTAALLLAGDGSHWVPRGVSNVKLRTFIAPGSAVSMKATRTGTPASDTLSALVESRINQRLVGSAEILFRREAVAS